LFSRASPLPCTTLAAQHTARVSGHFTFALNFTVTGPHLPATLLFWLNLIDPTAVVALLNLPATVLVVTVV
jgi:hypothetical protein